MHVSSRQNYPLHRYFSVYTLQSGKLIPFLLLPEEFTILQSVLCEVPKEREIDGESRVIITGFLLLLFFFLLPSFLRLHNGSFFFFCEESVKSVFASLSDSRLAIRTFEKRSSALVAGMTATAKKTPEMCSQCFLSNISWNWNKYEKKYQLEHAGHFK